MNPYDWEMDRDPWNWEWHDEVDAAWEWPRVPTGWDVFTPRIYEACPMGCDKGSYEWGPGFWDECPACAGTGLGKEHEC